MTALPVTEREQALIDLLGAALRRAEADLRLQRVFSLQRPSDDALKDARDECRAATRELGEAFRALPDDALHRACLDAVYGEETR